MPNILTDDLTVDTKIDFKLRTFLPANKYVQLDSNNLIPSVDMGTGGADNTVFLRGDRAWVTASPNSTIVPASYIIYKSGANTNAVNGITGATDFTNVDSFTTIQNAINNLASGGKIYIKSGTYSLSSPIDISDKTIEIIGEHRFNTVLSRAGDVIRILNVTGVDGLTAQQSVNNITLDGVNKSGIGLGLSRIFRCVFDNLYIKNCNNAIHLDRTIANLFKSPYIESSNIGMLFDTDVTTTTSFNNSNVVMDGEINNGNPGVLMYGSSSGNKFYGTVLEGSNTTQLIIKTAFLTVNSQDSVPNVNVVDGCWFETSGVVSPVHIDIQKDALSTNYPWSNVITKCFFAADVNYTAINNPGPRNQFVFNYLSGTVGNTDTIAISGNDNVVAFNSVAFNSLSITNSGSRNLLKTNFGFTTFLTVLSGTFAIDSLGPKAVSIAHGLAITPNVQDCSVTAVQNTAVTDWAGQIIITSTNGTNVNVTVNITTASNTAGATAKLSLRVGKP